MQLMKNIEQRKQTIVKVCYSIVARQQDFLENGIDHLKPMMIKEVAEEIGVHPSTVSRAVSSKYVHSPQGVFELRYFFSESVNGPEGGGTSLLLSLIHISSEGEVGKCGVAIDSLEDMEILFDGIDLEKTTVSMTINSPASVLWAMYLVVAEKQGADWKKI